MNFKEENRFIEKIRNALKEDLPGTNAQQKMAPEGRGLLPKMNNPVSAAVMVLIFQHNDQLSTIYIKRNVYNGPHSGQISFPGGKKETYDESIIHTALRETKEELGADLNIEILGSLTTLDIPISNFVVQPMVGYIKDKFTLNPDISEVQYVIYTPFELLIQQKNTLSMPMQSLIGKVNAPYYSFNNEIIWGATAMITCEFIEILNNSMNSN